MIGPRRSGLALLGWVALMTAWASALGAGAAQAQVRPWPERLNPVWFGGAAARVRPTFAAQLRSTSDSATGMVPDVRVQRLRLGARASWLDGVITSSLQIEANPSSAELIDAWIEVTPLPSLRLRAGQFKSPFTAYFQRSLTQLAVDWPLTSRWFGGERQLGVMTHGAVGAGESQGGGLRYAVGIFGGQNRRGAFARELARVYGHPLRSPSRFTAPASTQPPHPELIARLEYAGAGAVQYVVGLSGAWDAQATRAKEFALRIAPEAQLDLGSVRAHAVGYAGFMTGADGVVPAAIGLHVELSWRAHRLVHLVLRYSRVHLLPRLVQDATDTRAGETSPADNRPEPIAPGRQEVAFAVNGLVVGRGVAVQAELAWLRTERVGEALDHARLRVQMQVAF